MINQMPSVKRPEEKEDLLKKLMGMASTGMGILGTVNGLIPEDPLDVFRRRMGPGQVSEPTSAAQDPFSRRRYS